MQNENGVEVQICQTCLFAYETELNITNSKYYEIRNEIRILNIVDYK